MKILRSRVYEAEREKKDKESAKLLNIRNKLNNKQFMKKAPSSVIDDFILIDEAKIAEGIKFNFEKHKLVTEGAAATSIMAVKDHLSSHFGKNTICLLCGGNIDSELFGKIIA